MSSIYKTYATDLKKESDGVPYKLSEANDDGTFPTFILGRMSESNKEYSKAVEVATRPYRKQMQAGTFSEATAKPLIMDAFVGYVLKGWENILDRNNTPIPFSAQAAKALFTELPDLYKELQEVAGERAMFREEVLEGESKN